MSSSKRRVRHLGRAAPHLAPGLRCWAVGSIPFGRAGVAAGGWRRAAAGRQAGRRGGCRSAPQLPTGDSITSGHSGRVKEGARRDASQPPASARVAGRQGRGERQVIDCKGWRDAWGAGGGAGQQQRAQQARQGGRRARRVSQTRRARWGHAARSFARAWRVAAAASRSGGERGACGAGGGPRAVAAPQAGQMPALWQRPASGRDNAPDDAFLRGLALNAGVAPRRRFAPAAQGAACVVGASAGLLRRFASADEWTWLRLESQRTVLAALRLMYPRDRAAMASV